jgi:hypothetical protein
MDTQLEALINQGEGKTISFRTGEGTVEIRDKNHPDQKQEYPLKPLPELYGAGLGLQSVDLKDGGFLPLLLAIEETFVLCYRNDPSLTDGAVLLALDKLCMSPEADAAQDELVIAVQLKLRLVLSLNDYSRQDVRQALRKVKQSANRHNRDGGRRGYLDFITRMLAGR